MRRVPPPRRLVLAGLLLLVLIAGAGPGEDKRAPEVVAAVERAQTSAPAPRREVRRTAAPEIDLSKLTRAPSRDASRDPFAPRSFYKPPPPPPAPIAMPLPPPPPPPAPPPPSAPPLPFTYMGKMTDDPARPVYFLVKGGRLFNVEIGDVIEGTYRLDSVAGANLRIIYLPLDIPQVLAMGDS